MVHTRPPPARQHDGFETRPIYLPLYLALLGNAYLIPSIFLIIASLDPIKHIMWVQMAISWTILDIVTTGYYVIRGSVSFGQVAPMIVIDGFFAVVFLVLYPRRLTQPLRHIQRRRRLGEG